MLNKSELILDKVRSLVAHELGTGKAILRLTSLEDSSLNCTAESEEVTDAIGAVITTLYRAKKAEFSATNSLISLDLAAAQYGTKKEVATAEKKFKSPTYEILEVADGKVTLKETPVSDIKYIYGIADGELGTIYEAGESVEGEGNVNFVHSVAEGANAKEITVGAGITGKVYVEYEYETSEAVRVVNMAANFPEAVSVVVYCYFRDKCNENIVYSGKIICPKAKLNPEQIELALTSTGKHPFTFTINKDYCEEDGELFTILVTE